MKAIIITLIICGTILLGQYLERREERRNQGGR